MQYLLEMTIHVVRHAWLVVQPELCPEEGVVHGHFRRVEVHKAVGGVVRC